MNRPTVPPPPVGPTLTAEPPTEPGIWKKLLPDGRVVPWIVLPTPPAEADPPADPAHRNAWGCGKGTN